VLTGQFHDDDDDDDDSSDTCTDRNSSSSKTKTEAKRRRHTKLSRIKKSRSIQTVYWALCPDARRKSANGKEDDANAAADLFRTTNPLLAAAALRRVADLRALQATYRLRRERGQARPSRSKDRWEEQESCLARVVLLPSLIRCVGNAVLCDVRLMNGARSSSDNKDYDPMKAGEEDGDNYVSVTMGLENIDECSLPVVGIDNPVQTRRLGPESLLDVLYGLAKLSDIKKRTAAAAPTTAASGDDAEGSGGNGSFRPLAVSTCRAIKSDDEGASYTTKLWHTSLVETVWSLAVLDLRDETVLLTAIGNRLEKGDALGKLTGKQLVTVLWSYASLGHPHQGVMRAFMRRLRKIRHQLFASHIAQAIWSAARLIERLDDEAELEDAPSDELDVAAAQLREEAIMLCHTLSNELMSPVSNDSALPKMLDLAAGASADILSAFATLEISEAPILSALSCHLRQPNTTKYCKLQDIARLLLSFQRLGLKEETQTIGILCNRFTQLLHTTNCDGKTLNTILRSVVMLLPDDGSCKILFDAAARIINDDDLGIAICSLCSEFEVSSILWSFAKAKHIDDGVMVRLANRMMEEDISQLCSPSSVSRILWSYTVLLSMAEDRARQGDDNIPIEVGQRLAERRETLFLLFQSLSWVLLSSQLNPIDCTAAMWAMAHASYPLDLSVFDHLAETLAADNMLERSSTECISQALWSCGKMSGWEGMNNKQEYTEEASLGIPPYVESAEKYAYDLLSRKEDMSPKDVAQAIWSIGRLSELTDVGEQSVEEFASLAVGLASGFNGVEVTSILYGLARLGYNDESVVGALTSRFLEPPVLAGSTAREMSSVMFSLGMMGHRDVDLFAKLSTAMMENVDDTSSLSIANALTAYEAVDMAPPRILFDRWASEKLGIMARHSFISQIVGDAVASPAEAITSGTGNELME